MSLLGGGINKYCRFSWDGNEMAEEDQTEDVAKDQADGDENQEAPKKSKKKLFIIIGAALLVLILGGGAAYFFLFKGAKEEVSILEEAKPVFFYDLAPITVNLSSVGNAEVKFLKLSVSLEIPDEEMIAILEPRMARVQDAFQVYLRELRPSDLEGSAGIFLLKEELRRRVNLAIYPAKVENILFKEILIQ